MYQVEYRVYDPKQGRFMQQDPLTFGMGDYTYAYNSPANFNDPSGLVGESYEYCVNTFKNIGKYIGGIVMSVLYHFRLAAAYAVGSTIGAAIGVTFGAVIGALFGYVGFAIGTYVGFHLGRGIGGAVGISIITRLSFIPRWLGYGIAWQSGADIGERVGAGAGSWMCDDIVSVLSFFSPW